MIAALVLAATIHASFSPSAVQFGDATTARVVVNGDSSRLAFSVAPLTQLGPTRVRHARGIVTYEMPVACLTSECASDTGRKVVTPPPIRGSAWQPLTVDGRVDERDLRASRLPFRADTTPPSPTYRVRPTLLAAALDVAGAILALAGLTLVAVAVLRTRRRADAQPDELTRALRLARAARDRPEPDRRRAAGYVARLLARREGDLARRADDLAWSRPAPTPDSLVELVEGVEREQAT
jgi:hypothetical protein